jgi:diamine N-acetyltransferase
MRHGFEIRRGRAEDANRLAVLAAQVWLHTYATDGINDVVAQYTLSELTPEKYVQSLHEPATHFLLAEHNESLFGFAVVNHAVAREAGDSVEIFD